MKCKTCNDTESYHNWKQRPYCSPFCRGDIKSTEIGGVLKIDGITQAARNAQRGHEKDILQPLKKDGTFNKAFVEAHGTKSIAKEYKIKPEHIEANIAKYG